MKTKILLFLILSAIVTLSFQVVSVNSVSKKHSNEATPIQSGQEPVGGLASEDKL